MEGDAEGSQTANVAMFGAFRSTLDAHHDRRERIIKTSRDITAQSKKVIFSLQRTRSLGASLPGAVRQDVSSRLEQITQLFQTIIPEISSPSLQWRYHRQISPALQEFVEAMAFKWYLEKQQLLTYSEAQRILIETAGPAKDDGATIIGSIRLPVDDYVLGICDTVGEIMRWGITSMATTGAVPFAEDAKRPEDAQKGQLAKRADLLSDLRSIQALLEGLNTSGAGNEGQGTVPLGRELVKKMEVLRQCVQKVENAVYGIIVRGREKPKGWMPELRERSDRFEDGS